MPNIRTSVVINQPLERVFEFVIRACRQSQWHWTASCTTSDTPPPALGDSFTEDFLVGREARPDHLDSPGAPPATPLGAERGVPGWGAATLDLWVPGGAGRRPGEAGAVL
jgi:hypothetical protein